MRGFTAFLSRLRYGSGVLARTALVTLALCLSSCAFLDRAAAVPDDTAIRDEVRANLEADGFTAIGLQVDNGVVTLTGHLPNDTFREKAVADAEKASGVKHVTNQIAVP